MVNLCSGCGRRRHVDLLEVNVWRHREPREMRSVLCHECQVGLARVMTQRGWDAVALSFGCDDAPAEAAGG